MEPVILKKPPKFNIGDLVRIIKPTEICYNVFTQTMESMVGTIHRVTKISPLLNGDYEYQLGGDAAHYWWDFTMLELVPISSKLAIESSFPFSVNAISDKTFEKIDKAIADIGKQIKTCKDDLKELKIESSLLPSDEFVDYNWSIYKNKCARDIAPDKKKKTQYKLNFKN